MAPLADKEKWWNIRRFRVRTRSFTHFTSAVPQFLFENSHGHLAVFCFDAQASCDVGNSALVLGRQDLHISTYHTMFV
jgi:hypothetical protein